MLSGVRAGESALALIFEAHGADAEQVHELYVSAASRADRQRWLELVGGTLPIEKSVVRRDDSILSSQGSPRSTGLTTTSPQSTSPFNGTPQTGATPRPIRVRPPQRPLRDRLIITQPQQLLLLESYTDARARAGACEEACERGCDRTRT